MIKLNCSVLHSLCSLIHGAEIGDGATAIKWFQSEWFFGGRWCSSWFL